MPPRDDVLPTNRRDRELDLLFGALADPTRRHLLARLALGPARITDLARPYRMSLPAVSKHLKILERAGLVGRTVDGRVHRMTLRGRRLEQVEVWLDPFRSFWAATLHGLKAEVERTARRPRSRTRRTSIRGRRKRRGTVRAGAAASSLKNRSRSTR
jgi:DNA-binding transcriptional ArsR family regulator